MPSGLMVYFFESKMSCNIRDKMKLHPYIHSLCGHNAFYFVPIGSAFWGQRYLISKI